MKILFCTNHLNGTDGWSRYSVDLISEIQSAGHNVLCLTHKESNQKEIKELVIFKEPLRYLANPFLSAITAYKVSKIIKEFSPDIIHFMVEPFATILPFLNVGKAKTFLTICGTYSFIPILISNIPKKIISGYLAKMVYKKIDEIIAISNFTKNYLLGKIENPCILAEIKEKIKIITNGIDLKNFKITDYYKKINESSKNILFVGAIKPRKGLSEAIEALRAYCNTYSKDFLFYIVGYFNREDKYYQKLIEKIKEYNFEDKIIFKGRVSSEELDSLYKNADLFLMTSINNGKEFEGFGLVYLEANAMGVPCIGPNDSGAREAILDGKTGYAVNPYNKKEIAEKINLILNKSIINSDDCIDWAKKNDIKIKAQKILDLYYAIIRK